MVQFQSFKVCQDVGALVPGGLLACGVTSMRDELDKLVQQSGNTLSTGMVNTAIRSLPLPNTRQLHMVVVLLA